MYVNTPAELLNSFVPVVCTTNIYLLLPPKNYLSCMRRKEQTLKQLKKYINLLMSLIVC